MGEKGERSGGKGGGKWGKRGREVGGKGEGSGNGVPPCPPPLIIDQNKLYKKIQSARTIGPLSARQRTAIRR